MPSTVSEFFSRDINLKRQARTYKRSANLCPSTSLNEPLSIIMEEDEPRLSSSSISRSSSPLLSLSSSPSRPSTPGLKSRRRQALTPSDIRISRNALIHADDNSSRPESSLLSSPRPAPRPPTPSPGPSPDPFSLSFIDSSFHFPYPPMPSLSSTFFEQYRPGLKSPTPSIVSSSSTSPESTSMGLPTTPSDSDDDFSYYYSSPLQAAIKPLVITKHNSPEVCDETHDGVSAATLEEAERDSLASPPSPLSSIGRSAPDADESDSDWYAREFSQILSLCASNPAIVSQPSRPDSLFILPALLTPSPSTATHDLQDSPLDQEFSQRRRYRFSVPGYPPPPIPASQSAQPWSDRRSSKVLFVPSPSIARRPPPRSSIPADCVSIDHDFFDFSDDTASAFSLSLYEDAPRSPGTQESSYSYMSPFISSFPSTPTANELDFRVDDNREVMLPLSIPCSPINLEADIATGLEHLRLTQAIESPSYRDGAVDDFFTSASRFESGAGSASSCESDESRGLRSRWSSSTLASVREEHTRLSASAKLRSYFSVVTSPKGKTHFRGGSSSGSGLSPKKSGPSELLSSSERVVPMSPNSVKRFKHARREMDVMVIGYEYGQAGHGQGQGLRRRGSTHTVSDAGSEESSSSSGSSGLRRKPIPVEMFLRSAA